MLHYGLTVAKLGIAALTVNIAAFTFIIAVGNWEFCEYFECQLEIVFSLKGGFWKNHWLGHSKVVSGPHWARGPLF